jgi:hypothetical protein
VRNQGLFFSIHRSVSRSFNATYTSPFHTPWTLVLRLKNKSWTLEAAFERKIVISKPCSKRHVHTTYPKSTGHGCANDIISRSAGEITRGERDLQSKVSGSLPGRTGHVSTIEKPVNIRAVFPSPSDCKSKFCMKFPRAGGRSALEANCKPTATERSLLR